ncbi:hypothetical protein Tco_0121736 [Tanacetum coccineum]
MLIDEGSCYEIGNFGVGDNGSKYPLLNHRYKMNFYKNTYVTRAGNFDNNTRGFKFEPFANFTPPRQFSETDVVDVIGTVVSMTDCILFNNFGVDKIRRTLILKDVDGVKLGVTHPNSALHPIDVENYDASHSDDEDEAEKDVAASYRIE